MMPDDDLPSHKALWAFFVFATIGLDTSSATALWWAAWNELTVNSPLIFTTIVLAMNILVMRWMLTEKG